MAASMAQPQGLAAHDLSGRFARLRRMLATPPAKSPSPARRRSLPLAPDAATRVPPRSVRMSLTDRCDLACVYCRPSRSDGSLEKRLDDAAWQTMARALVEAGVRRVRITGGEPLLHPHV